MNKDKLSVGDIGLYHGSSFIAKAIQLFMKKYARKLGLPEREKLYNHAFAIIEMWGQVYVVEALADGMNIQPIEKAYPDKKWKDIIILTPKKSFSKAEKERFNKAALKSVMIPTRYGYADILFHARAILSKKGYDVWRSKGDKDDDRMHCTEAVATFANKARYDMFERPWSTNPLDLELSNKYKIKNV
jgi:hypothetical protein